MGCSAHDLGVTIVAGRQKMEGASMNNIARLRDFVTAMTAVVDRHGEDEAALLEQGRALLGDLIGTDDWLPEAFAKPSEEGYRQYLLYCDPLERFSVVSFVWGPGQHTPVHDHTVWGMVGVMRGAERCEEYGNPVRGERLEKTGEHRVEPGGIDLVSPRLGDVHVVSNALTDRPSISIHVYGGNIGAVRRHVFDTTSGETKDFISGYHNTVVPNLWDRSSESGAG
jgi:predicted metal-dependent enzyme (double-stranded beta helix superfamily)